MLGGIKRDKVKICFGIKKEVALSIEVPKKMKLMLEEFKRVVHDKLPKGLPPMRDTSTTLILFMEQVYLISHTTE